MKFLTRKRGTARQVGKKFPVGNKNVLPPKIRKKLTRFDYMRIAHDYVKKRSEEMGIQMPKVRFNARIGGEASYNPYEHRLTVNTKAIKSPEQLKYLLEHELGHAERKILLKWKIATGRAARRKLESHQKYFRDLTRAIMLPEEKIAVRKSLEMEPKMTRHGKSVLRYYEEAYPKGGKRKK